MKNFSRAVSILEGPIASSLIIFALPILASNLLQILYNAADMMVLGQFVGDSALAAVAASGQTHNLIVNIFIGIGAGVGVVVAQNIGAGDREKTEKSVHTAMALSVVTGIAVLVLGLIFSPLLLEAIDTPKDIIGDSTLYLRILFLAAPAVTVYNFGASILRSSGDTKRPFFFLAISGLINVILNLVFVIVLGMSVDGVALATAISQYVSAYLVVRALMKNHGNCHLEIRHLAFHKEQALHIIKIGVPAGIQSAVFSIANLFIQTFVNGFGTPYVAAAGATASIENIMYTSAAAIGQASMVFIGQNYGAKNSKRIKDVYKKSILIGIITACTVATVFIIFRYQLVSIFASGEQVINIAARRFVFLAAFIPFQATMDISLYCIRGMGHSFVPMISMIFGIVVLRMVWLVTIFAWFKTYDALMLVFGVTWAITAIIEVFLFIYFYKKAKKKLAA